MDLLSSVCFSHVVVSVEAGFVFLEASRVFGGVSTGAKQWRRRRWLQLDGMGRGGVY